MIKKDIIQVPRAKIISITCDKCGVEASPEDVMEFQEFYCIRFTGGYASIFGDESKVEADFCQKCLKEIIGPYYRIEGD